MLPGVGWTKCHDVICTCTSKCTCLVVIGVAIRSRARGFEHLWIHGWCTRCWWIICAFAAVFWCWKSCTRTIASAATLHPQLSGALQVQILDTTCGCTWTRPTTHLNNHLYVVAIHEAYIIEVLAAWPERELGQCSRGSGSSTIALNLAWATVRSGAWALTRPIKVASSSAPEPARPACWSLEGSRASLV